MKKKLKNMIPKYAYIPFILVIIMQLLAYNGSKIITNNMFHHTFITSIDLKIPFKPVFISIYILAYIQWVIGYILIAKENKETCYRIFSAELISKLLCFLIFLIYPTIMVRPEITNKGVWSFLTSIIYFFDEPVNLFPSIHCIEGWLIARSSTHLKKVSKGYKIGQYLFTLLVFASVLFVKQHLLIDIIGGILVVEISLLLAKTKRVQRIFEKIINKITNQLNKRKRGTT